MSETKALFSKNILFIFLFLFVLSSAGYAEAGEKIEDVNPPAACGANWTEDINECKGCHNQNLKMSNVSFQNYGLETDECGGNDIYKGDMQTETTSDGKLIVKHPDTTVTVGTNLCFENSLKINGLAIIYFYYVDGVVMYTKWWPDNDTYSHRYFYPGAGIHTYKVHVIYCPNETQNCFGWRMLTKEWTVEIKEEAIPKKVEIIGYHYRDGQKNDKYVSPLEDNTLLTSNDPIVIKVTSPHPDSSVRNTLELKVKSQEDPNEITIIATESGPNTGIFYNYNPFDSSDSNYNSPLYLGTITEGNKVKVDDENEVITVYLKDFPDVSDTIILDLAEIGVGWFANYRSKGCIFDNLFNTKTNAEYVYNTLGAKGWKQAFNNGNEPGYGACLESQYNMTGDSDLNGIDKVDFAVWAGHGPARTYEAKAKDGTIYSFEWTEPALHFMTEDHIWTNHASYATRPDNYDLYRDEARWGDKDLDWIALFTCSFLKDPDSPECRQIGNGVRMVLGFSDVMNMLPPSMMSELFFEYMTKDGRSIKDAWIKMSQYQYNGDREGAPKDQHIWDQFGTGVAIFDNVTENDHLPDLGSYVKGLTFTINKSQVEVK